MFEKFKNIPFDLQTVAKASYKWYIYMDSIYYKKNLNYREKYLALKNQIGRDLFTLLECMIEAKTKSYSADEIDKLVISNKYYIYYLKYNIYNIYNIYMDSLYHKKYLKYRQKYLALKNQISGGGYEDFSKEDIIIFFNRMNVDDFIYLATDESLKSKLKDKLLIRVLNNLNFTSDEQKICDLFISYAVESNMEINFDAFIKFYSFKDILLMIGDIESQKQRLLITIRSHFRDEIIIELIKYLFMAYNSNNRHLNLHEYTKDQLTTLYRSIIDSIENALQNIIFNREQMKYLLRLLKFLEKKSDVDQISFIDRILRFNERQYKQLVEYIINRQKRNAINFIEYDLPDEDLEKVYAYFENKSKYSDEDIRNFIRNLPKPCPKCHNEPCTCQMELSDIPPEILYNILSGLDLRGLINFGKLNPIYEAEINRHLPKLLRQIIQMGYAKLRKTDTSIKYRKDIYEEIKIIQFFLLLKDRPLLNNIRFLSILEYTLLKRNIKPENIYNFFLIIVNNSLKKERSKLIVTLLEHYYREQEIIIDFSQKINPVLFNSIVAQLRDRDDSYAKGKHDHAFKFIDKCVIKSYCTNNHLKLIDYFLKKIDDDTSLTSLYELINRITPLTPQIADCLLNLFSDPKMHDVSPDEIRKFFKIYVDNNLTGIYCNTMVTNFKNGNMTNIKDLLLYAITIHNYQINNYTNLIIIIDCIFEYFKGKPFDEAAVNSAIYSGLELLKNIDEDDYYDENSGLLHLHQKLSIAVLNHWASGK
jgi:hypothetical protein